VRGIELYVKALNASTPPCLTSDNTRYVTLGVGAGAQKGWAARMLCEPAPGVRCAGFVGGGRGDCRHDSHLLVCPCKPPHPRRSPQLIAFFIIFGTSVVSTQPAPPDRPHVSSPGGWRYSLASLGAPCRRSVDGPVGHAADDRGAGEW
jgi:hypothetical protein